MCRHDVGVFDHTIVGRCIELLWGETAVNKKYAFCVSGTQSGCGKTTATLGLIAVLGARGYRVQPFKVGPDFIDPGLHTKICGRESRNLDGWMLSKAYNRRLFADLLDRSDIAVVEGVMGLFDGYDGTGEAGSSAEMAKWLGIPAVLIVDARSMARSAAALVLGFSRFDPGLRIAGVIFNRIGGAGHLEYLKEAMQVNLPEIPVLGGIPREEGIRIPERHLGLVTADEVALGSEWREKLIELLEAHLNVDLLLEQVEYGISAGTDAQIGSRQDEIEASGVLDGEDALPSSLRTAARRPPKASHPISIAVARDAAFCFYYPDNLELLRAAGARIAFFSPLEGDDVPEESEGIYLGGGYPELFADKIAENQQFLESLRRSVAKGIPIYAECGGLMALGRFIETLDGRRYSMAGILPFGTRMLPRRKALGYTEVIVQRPCLLGPAGAILRGHEFHYSEIIEAQDDPDFAFAYRIQKRKLEADRLEGYMNGPVLASYVHLHWGSNPSAAWNFVEHCRLQRT
jgi:cobyrinic acid a,c-diamide synthase